MQSPQVREVQGQLSSGVWLGGRPDFFLAALGVTRILDAWYVALVMLNGVTTAALLLGPSSWWLILLLCAPIAISAQLATLIVRDFSMMYAMTQASADILMEVEYNSSVMQRTYEELRSQFQSMFIRANPSTADMLAACFDAFRAADTDASGLLSHREFAELIRLLTGEAASAKMLTKLLRCAL